MKNLLKRVMSIAAATALLMTSVISASAADPGHSHGGGTEISDKSGPYTITLSHPDGKTAFDSNNSHYGAYQIFSGTVKGEPTHTDPGTNSESIPITDIKWGNAFGIIGTDGISSEDDIHKNILGFVYALSQAKTGDYSYAFGDFDGFVGLFTKNGVLDKAYCKVPDAQVNVTLDGNIVTSITNDANVNYDKLAVHIADVLVEPTHIDNHEWLQAFNDILGGYGQGEDGNYKNPGYVKCYYEGSVATDTSKYEIKVPAGYYMIRDLSSFEGADKSYSARMLFVADNVTQELKEAVPTLEKKIIRVDGNTYETEAAGVGDEVKFQLHGTLPSNYDLYLGGYQYKFTDKLSDGLTLKEIKADTYVTVKVKGVYDDGSFVNEEYTIDKEKSYKKSGEHITQHDTINAAYKEEYNEETNELIVTFPCLKEILIDDKYTLGVDSQIYITYTAVVNKDAIVSPTNGNKNTAVLTYSDNPQSYGDTDDTTEDKATVYTFGLDIIKVDAAQFLKKDGDETADGVSLANAEFVIARPSDLVPNDNTTWEYAIFKFISAEDAKKMTPVPTVKSFTDNGYYTIVSWEIIDDADKKGAKFDPAWIETTTVAITGVNGNAIKSGDKGVLNISGLNDEITYTIAETKAPTTDYAKIEPFTIKLTAAKSGEEYTGKLSGATSDKDTTGAFSFDKPVDITDKFEGTPETDTDGSANMLVANFKYTDLPSTGGIGVYIYYIAGGCAVVLALVLFALSKKKRSDK